jgi:hypothetical protein
MPLTPSFTISQNVLYPNLVIATDDSDGSDIAVTQRRIYVSNSVGTYLVPSGTSTDYSQWIYANSSISLDILTEDTAVSVRVDWLDVSNTVLYTETETYCLALYNKQFLYELVQGMQPSITLDTNYNPNTANLWVAILGAENSVEVGGDIVASQACLDRATYLRTNQSNYF